MTIPKKMPLRMVFSMSASVSFAAFFVSVKSNPPSFFPSALWADPSGPWHFTQFWEKKARSSFTDFMGVWAPRPVTSRREESIRTIRMATSMDVETPGQDGSSQRWRKGGSGLSPGRQRAHHLGHHAPGLWFHQLPAEPRHGAPALENRGHEGSILCPGLPTGIREIAPAEPSAVGPAAGTVDTVADHAALPVEHP